MRRTLCLFLCLALSQLQASPEKWKFYDFKDKDRITEQKVQELTAKGQTAEAAKLQADYQDLKVRAYLSNWPLLLTVHNKVVEKGEAWAMTFLADWALALVKDTVETGENSQDTFLKPLLGPDASAEISDLQQAAVFLSKKGDQILAASSDYFGILKLLCGSPDLCGFYRAVCSVNLDQARKSAAGVISLPAECGLPEKLLSLSLQADSPELMDLVVKKVCQEEFRRLFPDLFSRAVSRELTRTVKYLLSSSEFQAHVFTKSKDPLLYELVQRSRDEEILDLMLAKGTVELQVELLPAVKTKETAAKLRIELLKGPKDRKLAAIEAVSTYAAAEYLIEKGLDPDQEEGFEVPLTITSEPEVARALLAHGADLNILLSNRKNPGATKDCLLSRVKNRAIADLLIASGLDLKKKGPLGNTMLHCEVITSEIALMLLDYGISPNERDNSGRTPIFCMPNNLPVAKLLLDRGADPKIRDKAGNTPLFCSYFDPEVAKLLLSRGLSANDTNEAGDTPLHLISFDTESVEFLIRNGADVNARNRKGETPIFGLSKKPYILKILIAHGADPKAVNLEGKNAADVNVGIESQKFLSDQGVTAKRKNDLKRGSDLQEYLKSVKSGEDILAEYPLRSKPVMEERMYRYPFFKHIYEDCYRFLANPIYPESHDEAISQGIELIDIFLKKGGKPDLQSMGMTLMMMMPYPKPVRMLLDAGADPFAADSLGRTPLFYAADLENNQEAVEMLVSAVTRKGVKLADLTDKKGCNLLMTCRKEYTDYFLKQGVPVNATDKTGRTVLMGPSMFGDKLDKLIAAGADCNAVDSNGDSALHHAVLRCIKASVERLLKANANPVIRNKQGKTPLDVALTMAEKKAVSDYMMNDLLTIIELLKQAERKK
ncbi:MAG: ankyrin repeat domain-containing protein [Candidatus Wallbacteria bacterium]|nr:ankyrin repeat domain-containing protein [Candidatus Wallbacteria bacterium]